MVKLVMKAALGSMTRKVASALSFLSFVSRLVTVVVANRKEMSDVTCSCRTSGPAGGATCKGAWVVGAAVVISQTKQMRQQRKERLLRIPDYVNESGG